MSAMREQPEPADVAWIGLSLHHLQTPDKQVLMREVRAAIGDGDPFLIYEPVRHEGKVAPRTSTGLNRQPIPPGQR